MMTEPVSPEDMHRVAALVREGPGADPPLVADLLDTIAADCGTSSITYHAAAAIVRAYPDPTKPQEATA